MAKTVTKISMVGEWIARDNQGWRVRVPCQNGHQYFGIKEYGGSTKALNAARAFHTKACRQYQADKKYYQEHGEKVQRTTLNIRNRSGYTGIARMVYPNLDGKPLVVFTAYVNRRGKQITQRFSLTEYKHEEYALEAAIEWREKHNK